MKLIYPILFIALLIIACKDDKKQAPPATDPSAEDSVEMEIVDSVLAMENLDSFSTSGFPDYAQKQAGFDWSNFRLTNTWTEDSLLTSNFTPDKKYYEAYGSLLEYSPDSSMFIDLDSYNMDIVKNSKGQLIATPSGPDYEVSLVDLKSREKKRLLFLGPGSSVEDAMWLDNHNLALIGVQDYDDSTGKVASVWKYNIPSNTFYLYEWKDKGVAQQLIGEWRKERLKGIIEQ